MPQSAAEFVWKEIAKAANERIIVWFTAIHKEYYEKNVFMIDDILNYACIGKLAIRYLNKLNDQVYLRIDKFVAEDYDNYALLLGGELPCALLELIMYYYRDRINEILNTKDLKKINFISEPKDFKKQLVDYLNSIDQQHNIKALKEMANHCSKKGTHTKNYKKDPFYGGDYDVHEKKK